MRKLICRFENQTILDEFNFLNNLKLTKDMKIYNLDTGEATYKRKIASPAIPNETWKQFWIDMPEFVQNKKEAYAKIEIYSEKSVQTLSKLFNQKITTKTKSIWYPQLDRHTKTNFRVVGGNGNPEYPIYVVSKNRSKLTQCITVRYLNALEVKHFLVVEPQQYDDYSMMIKDLKYTSLLKLDLSFQEKYDTLDDLGTTKPVGPGAARNFCWQHSLSNNYDYHWVMDDNIDGFHYINNNIKYKVRTGTIFKIAEDFFKRFDNMAIGGLNYSKFCKECDRVPAYVTNTRIYSCMFIDNHIPFKWRGRYNEDTILSLDVLTHGYNTIQLNCFLADKTTTQRIKGGNTDMFYQKEGTLNKSQMLVNIYPQYAKLTYKFNRVHHQVDYSSFTKQLEYKQDYSISNNTVNNYNLCIIKVNDDLPKNLDYKSYLENHISEYKKIK